MLTLSPNPTFKAKVGIPVPGQEKPVMVEFEFVAMTRSELEQWGTDSKDREDDERVPLIVRGWVGVDKPFSHDALLTMLDQYPGSARAMVSVFYRELTGARLGN